MSQLEHLEQILHRFVGPGPISLVDDQDVGDFDDARLDGLNVVTRSRKREEAHRVDDRRDVDLLLPHPGGFHQDHVEPDGIEHTHDPSRRPRQTTLGATVGHAADEHAGIEVAIAHPDPVAENGAARVGTGRIHRDDCHPRDGAPVRGRQHRDQCAFSRAGGTGEPDLDGAAGLAEGRAQDVRPFRLVILDQRKQAGRGTDPPRPGARQPLLDPAHVLATRCLGTGTTQTPVALATSTGAGRTSAAESSGLTSWMIRCAVHSNWREERPMESSFAVTSR